MWESFTRIARQTTCNGLGGGWEIELGEDAALALGQLHRMNNATERHHFLDERTKAKRTQDAFRRHPFFGNGRVVSNRLAIEALHQVVGRQRDLEQIDECLDVLGRFEKQRPDRQG